MDLLTVSQLSYTYPGNPVLDDINLTVKQGETVSLLGGSGVGKSTLFNLIAGILPLQSGSIQIEGSTDYVGRVSYMLQKDLLLEHKTILGNVTLPLYLQKMSRQEARAEARAVLREFGLDAYEKHYPAELSGGMRQRIALIRTYLFRQKLFLLDEAFSALDALTKIQLHAWYQEAAKKLGLTTLLITHDIDEAIVLSDRIYLMANKPGTLIAEIPVSLPEEPTARDQRRALLRREILDQLGLVDGENH